MTDFSTWDILRNLLLAARWTLILSLVAFIGGGVVGAGGRHGGDPTSPDPEPAS